jgi:hypothetical protein
MSVDPSGVMRSTAPAVGPPALPPEGDGCAADTLMSATATAVISVVTVAMGAADGAGAAGGPLSPPPPPPGRPESAVA